MPAVPEAQRRVEKILVSVTRTDRRRAERVAAKRGESLAGLTHTALLRFLDEGEAGGRNGNGTDHEGGPG